MNRHNKQTDTIYRLFFDGFALSFYYATGNDKYLIYSLSVFSDKFKGKFGVSVGSSTNDILKEFGQPSKMSVNFIIYKFSYGGDGKSITFYLENGIVKRISF